MTRVETDGLCRSLPKIKSETSRERRCHLTSLASDARAFVVAAVRHIGLLRIACLSLDVNFNENQCNARKDNAPENFSVTAHIALKLIKDEKSKGSLKDKRKGAD